VSLPKHVHVRRNGSRIFAVVGDAGDGSSSMDTYRYREPHTNVTDVHTGTRFVVPTAKVERWPLVEGEQPRFAIGDRVIATHAPDKPAGRIVNASLIAHWDGDLHPDDYEYSPDELTPDPAKRTPDPERGPNPQSPTRLEVAARPGKGQAAVPTNSVRSAA